MGGWFSRRSGGGGGGSGGGGGKQPSRVTEQDKAVLELKVQRDKLKKYQKKVGIQMAKEKEVARQLLKDGKKERAKLLLKKKRYLESLLDKTDQQLDNLQQMVDNIEFAQVEMKVVEGLKTGNKCLEEMHKIMSLEDVEQIMAETQEAIEYQREIDELLGQNLTDEDEEAVIAELDSILVGELPEPGAKPLGEAEGEEDIAAQLPDVPTADPAAAQESAAQRELVAA